MLFTSTFHVLLTRHEIDVISTVYLKTAANDLYLNWILFVLTSWKRRTLKALIGLAYLIFSSHELWKQEIQHLKQVFHEKNRYRKWVVNQVVEQVKAKHRTVTPSNILPMDVLEQLFTTNEEKTHLLLLPYQGQKVNFVLKSMRTRLKTLLPNDFNT